MNVVAQIIAVCVHCSSCKPIQHGPISLCTWVNRFPTKYHDRKWS